MEDVNEDPGLSKAAGQIVEWQNWMEKIESSLFRIETPASSGTGFHIFLSDMMIGVATANHVVAHAHKWREPIKLIHHKSSTEIFLRPEDRHVTPLPEKDLAFILLARKELELVPQPFVLVREEKCYKPGVQIGWCGFPTIAPPHLCFFSGHISAWIAEEDSYLVDGVAINGVSGGPAFSPYYLGGVVTAYRYNRQSGEALPGACIVRHIGPYHDRLKDVRSFEEAAKEEARIASESNED